MARANPINVVIKGDYTDRDIKRAINDLNRLKTQGSGATAAFGTMSNQVIGFTKSFTAGFVGLGASLGGLMGIQAVVRMFGDSVKAAMEDQAAMASLAKTMENVDQAAATPQVEALIDRLQRATGVADDQLRPAFQKLVTVTQDAAESQRLLKLAMDISAGTGKDLEAVSMALAKAASGQTTALQRLGVGLDTATLKSKDMDLITAELSRKFAGQAATAASTYQGQLNRLKIGFDELQESMGYGFLNALNGGQDGTDNLMQSMKALEPVAAFFGKQIGENARGLVALLRELIKVKDGFDALGKQIGLGNTILSDFFSLVLRSPLGWLAMGLDKLTGLVDTGTDAWADYYRTASGAGYRPATGMGAGVTGGSMAGGRDWANFYAVNPSSQRALAASRNAGKDLWKAYVEGLDDASGGGGGGGGGGAKPLSKFQQDAQALLGTIAGLGKEIGLTTGDAGKVTFDKISTQIEAFKAKFSEAKQFAQGIVSTFMSGLDLGAALESAKSAGTSIVEEFVKQGNRAKEFGARMKELLAAGLSKSAMQDIMDLGFDRGLDVMKALQDGNVRQNIDGINEVYSSVEYMANTVADQAKAVFYDAGLNLMLEMLRAMIEELMPEGKTRKRLMALMDSLAASMNRTATITIGVVGPGASYAATPTMVPIPTGLSPSETSDFIDGILMGGAVPFADGGIVTRPTFGVFGEAGPEALIPLDRMGSMGGNTYNINVSTGVGDPRQIGEQVVSYIKRFEAASGPVFARA